MNIRKENEKLQQFWDQYFANSKPLTINANEIKVENSLDEGLKYLGDHCQSILDIGTGLGFCLITSKLLGKTLQYGLGIDTSHNGILTAQKTIEASNMEGLEFRIGDHLSLNKLSDESFDGIVCSNFLDVIPEETSNIVIENIKRILKPEGLFLLKLNFYLTEELIEKLKMEKLDEGTYAINGIIRGVNHTTEEWISKFNDFSVIKTDEYERIPNGPKDRIILFKKRAR